MRAKSGFTLVEILIVVVILGILAAVVIPQFTNASTEAKENSLKSDLRTMRSQIELYKIKNSDSPPASLAVLVTGDYLREIPVNPFNSLATEGTAVDGTVGWTYVAATGEVTAGDTGTCINGTTLHSAL